MAISRKLIIPSDDAKLITVHGWGIFIHPATPADSPLWVCLKIINLRPETRRKRGQLRAFWLYWGVDEKRFRRSAHQRRFESEQPAVAAVVRALLVQLPELGVGAVEARIGTVGLVAERRRLAQLRARHRQEDRRRLEAAWDEAVVEDARRTLGDAYPRKVGSLGAPDPRE